MVNQRYTSIFLWFSYGFPMVFVWFSYGFSYGFPMVFLWFSYGFPMVFLWFSYGFPMWFSYGFPMVFLWFSYGFPMDPIFTSFNQPRCGVTTEVRFTSKAPAKEARAATCGGSSDCETRNVLVSVIYRIYNMCI